MNPYEKTAAEMKRQSEGPKRFSKTAATVGASVAGGIASFAPILARAAPFLSQYIPEELAIKGLSKISPKLGSFVKSAVDGGYDFQQVKDFIGDQINDSQQKETPAKDDRNIIQQYSPELNTFLSEKIKGGENPVIAAAHALFEKGNPFEPIIRKIEKDHKTTWAEIVKAAYGGGQGQGQQPAQQQTQQNALAQEAMQPPGSQPTGQLSAEAQAAAQSQGRQPFQGPGAQQQQGGQGAQALQAILQKINQKLGA